MDDDLFWPPLSGDGEDSEHRPAQPGGTSTGGALPGTSASDYRQPSTPVEDGHGGFATSAYPTEPLAHGEPSAVPESVLVRRSSTTTTPTPAARSLPPRPPRRAR
jgi:hypothetical protein